MAKFVSKYTNLKVCYKPTYMQVVNGIPVMVDGEDIDFVGGVYETDDKEKIKHIKKLPDFGVNIFEEKTEKQ